MKKIIFCCLLVSVLVLTGCSNCDPRFQHCGGSDPQMQNEIGDEVGQMLQ